MKITRTIHRPQIQTKAPAAKRSQQSPEPLLPIGPSLVGGGALALGSSMILSKDVGAFSDNMASALLPNLGLLGPGLYGAAVGGLSGATAGLVYARIASADKRDAEPLFAAIGGSLTGLAVGSLSGGISAACGATPMLAVPVSIAACVAFSFRDYFDSH